MVWLIHKTETGFFKKGCPLLLGLPTTRRNCYIMAGRGKRVYPRENTPNRTNQGRDGVWCWKAPMDSVKSPIQSPWGTRTSGSSSPPLGQVVGSNSLLGFFLFHFGWWSSVSNLPVCNFVFWTLRISTFSLVLVTTALEFPPQIYNHYLLFETFKISTLSWAGGGCFNILPQNPWWLFCVWDLWRALRSLSRQWRMPFCHLYLSSLSQPVSSTSLSNCDFIFLSRTKLCVHQRNELCGTPSWSPHTHRLNQGRLKIF